MLYLFFIRNKSDDLIMTVCALLPLVCFWFLNRHLQILLFCGVCTSVVLKEDVIQSVGHEFIY